MNPATTEELAARIPRKSRRPRRAVIAVAVLVLIAGGAYSSICLYSASILTAPRPRAERFDPRPFKTAAQDWSAAAEDGIRLRGWHLPSPAGRQLVIMVHGLWDCVDDIAGPALDLNARGYDVLLFDFRGHGRSDQDRLSMGCRERRDIRAALAWAMSNGFNPDRIGWIGYSMGGSTLLMEGAHNSDIRAAVIDSAFASLPEVLDLQLSRHSGLPGWFNPGILAAAHVAFSAPSADLIPEVSARSWKGRPLLVVHGKADHIVPVAHGERIARAAGEECQSILLSGVDHGQTYHADPTAYIDRIDRFFKRHLSP
jgi:alpha-beta hydrolase superfamily lysophospholipase